MPDERAIVLAALRGRSRTAYDPLGGMAESIGAGVLPDDLGVEEAARRLLAALTGAAYRRVVEWAADRVGLHVSAARPGAGDVKVVDDVLREADKVGERLREWADRLERGGRALVVRSSDPGVNAAATCCVKCGTPHMLIAAIDKAETEGREWTVVMVPEAARTPP